ncbi:hypothetical protein [Deinococcus puniceus]|uniref:Uncharacterized protein n=1 Tax=Deinococcus puniceus TaxID=1182568 RepID=A0A172T890_9DEIO|nr:hypothetical protein [Deinococcus puniceus]ANE43239.1 hypothetical protein SU48_05065 [Deinococcus puniceus]
MEPILFYFGSILLIMTCSLALARMKTAWQLIGAIAALNILIWSFGQWLMSFPSARAEVVGIFAYLPNLYLLLLLLISVVLVRACQKYNIDPQLIVNRKSKSPQWLQQANLAAHLKPAELLSTPLLLGLAAFCALPIPGAGMTQGFQPFLSATLAIGLVCGVGIWADVAGKSRQQRRAHPTS